MKSRNLTLALLEAGSSKVKIATVQLLVRPDHYWQDGSFLLHAPEEKTAVSSYGKRNERAKG